MTNVFDKLATAAPVNRQAAVDASAKGEHFVSRYKLPAVYWTDIPPLRPITASMRAQAEFTDFTGRRIGRLRVIGLLAVSPGVSAGNRAMWCVRCVCGGYESRSARSLKRGLSDRCVPCSRMHNMRMHGEQAAKGVFQSAPLSTFIGDGK